MDSTSQEGFPDQPKIIFMGTPDFAVPTLEALVAHGYPFLAAVTQPDKPKGRGRKTEAPAVKKAALAHRIEVLQPEKASDEGFCDLVRKKEPDLIIVVAFGQILRKKLLIIPRWGVINIHASLLPKFRGAAPIPWAIMNDEPKTGLTIMHMDEGLDTGPLLFQEEVPILAHETAGHLHDRLAWLAGELMVKSLKQMAGHPIVEKPQDHAAATYAPKIERDLSLIHWTESARKVSALIRGLDPRPGAYTLFQGEELKLFSSRAMDGETMNLVPGRVAGQREGFLVVETSQGRVGVGELQYPGKRRLPADVFLRGQSIPEGTVLGQ